MHLLADGATTLGYLSGLLGGVIALALVVSLTIVNMLVASVGSAAKSHVPNIAGSLDAVAVSTDPVPPLLGAINNDLSELSRVLDGVAGHLAVARQAFEHFAESA